MGTHRPPRPGGADVLVLPSRATPATFKPRRVDGDMNYVATKSSVPAAKYDKVTGRALDGLSTHSAATSAAFSRGDRAQPLTGNFISMSSPSTSSGIRSAYEPRSPGSQGAHVHTQFGSCFGD